MLIYLMIAIALIIIAGLSWYAASLLLQLKKQNENQRAQRTERNLNIAESIEGIVLAMEQGQCDYSEGVIRLCVLLDHFAPEKPVDFQQTYPQMHLFYSQIKDMATHSKRAALPKNERMKQDVERLKYEAESKAVIEQNELPKLKEYITLFLQQNTK
ncbi:DUF2489 domain-containing protein [Paraneptunicella aestuarii]|uniref:DUF2489 domain-containing protein n=1 Tax=Paraneptunicella aestuarii TaxID=2831148 RepID=UPI001E36058F|nr:DUF2489 domain-containing protein [Paraneptunicella aestuarii]UAA37716.1 DUF2489 domain-containing protein [Paraneptunicella aestuarii]